MDESPAPPMKPLVGRVVRTLTQTAQLARETFWLEGPRLPNDSHVEWALDDVIGEYEFAGPLAGPILLWDEPIGRVSQLESLLAEFFEGNLTVWQPAVDSGSVDARGMEPLSDAEFWEPIDAMRGSQSEKALNAAGRMISSHGDDFVLRWQETAALKALALVDSFRRHGLGELVADDVGMSVLGSVLSQGREAYAEVLDEPARWSRRSPSDHSSSVLYLGDLVVDGTTGAMRDVVTSFSEERERMRAGESRRVEVYQATLAGNGGLGRAEIEAALGEAPDHMDIFELTREDPQVTLEGAKAINDAMTHPPGYWMQARDIPESTTYFAARALVEIDGLIHHRLVYVAAPYGDVGKGSARAAMGTLGGRVCSMLEVSDRHYASANNDAVFEIKRRFRGTRDDYLTRYVSPRLADD
ncbi:MAG: hypothetical protein C0419_02855 [Microbacterium sp.]|nr:hypothetical protein [Microbacterium sp.]